MFQTRNSRYYLTIKPTVKAGGRLTFINLKSIALGVQLLQTFWKNVLEVISRISFIKRKTQASTPTFSLSPYSIFSAADLCERKTGWSGFEQCELVGNRVYSHKSKEYEIMSVINGVNKYHSDTFRCYDVLLNNKVVRLKSHQACICLISNVVKCLCNLK